MNWLMDGGEIENYSQRMGNRRAQMETSPLVMLKAWFEQVRVRAHHSAK